MKKYEVTYYWQISVDVEAENEHEARIEASHTQLHVSVVCPEGNRTSATFYEGLDEEVSEVV